MSVCVALHASLISGFYAVLIWGLCSANLCGGMGSDCCLCVSRRHGFCKGVTMKIKIYNSAGEKDQKLYEKPHYGG